MDQHFLEAIKFKKRDSDDRVQGFGIKKILYVIDN